MHESKHIAMSHCRAPYVLLCAIRGMQCLFLIACLLVASPASAGAGVEHHTVGQQSHPAKQFTRLNQIGHNIRGHFYNFGQLGRNIHAAFIQNGTAVVTGHVHIDHIDPLGGPVLLKRQQSIQVKDGLKQPGTMFVENTYWIHGAKQTFSFTEPDMHEIMQNHPGKYQELLAKELTHKGSNPDKAALMATLKLVEEKGPAHMQAKAKGIPTPREIPHPEHEPSERILQSTKDKPAPSTAAVEGAPPHPETPPLGKHTENHGGHPHEVPPVEHPDRKALSVATVQTG